MGNGSASEFFEQVAGLIGVTIVFGLLWVASTVLIFQRAAERRRRKREGLEQLPSFFTQINNWLQGTPALPSSNTLLNEMPENLDDFPMPSADSLTADIPMPNVNDLLADFDLMTEEIPPQPVIQLPPPQAAPEPIKTTSQPAAIHEPVYYSLPLVVPAESASMNYVPGSNELPPDAVELLRVWRDVSDGTLIVGIKDRLFATADELRDPDLSRRFSAVIKELNQLANSSASSALLPTGEHSVRPSVRKPEKQTEIVEAPPMTIADQIETFLQAKIVQNPALYAKNLHIRPAPHGGVLIETEGHYYESVNDVQDPAVREFLQQTIAEWEAHQ